MKTDWRVEHWGGGGGGGVGIQYSNIVRNICGKRLVILCACLFISSVYAAEINLSYCEKMWGELAIIGTQIVKMSL